MSSTISSVVSSTGSSQLEPIRTEVASMKKIHSELGSFLEIMKTYVTTSDNRFKSIQNSLTQLDVPAQTPSEANESPPGVRR